MAGERDPAAIELEAVLGALPHGIILLDRDGRVTLCTASAIELLELPAEFALTPYPAKRLVPHLDRPAAPPDAPGALPGDIFAFPGDRFVRITAHPIADGETFLLIEDVADQMAREKARLQAESEYRSLFDNSVYGIYRDRLDGTPIRANPALAALNGYVTEAEHIQAVTAKPGTWYADPESAAEFTRRMEAQGRVQDMVSEVLRHRTGERLWITENAWFVRDVEGKPVFIEGTILDATERMANLVAIERQANFDSLTGAANRFRFLERLAEETGARAHPCVLYMIDLDRFKEVNDSIGHAAGDAILQEVVRRLEAIAGEESLVARLGGGEFAILDCRGEALSTAAAIAARITASLSEAIAVAGRSIVVGASVGAAAFPGHAADAGELLRDADLALYEVKSGGRNGYRIYDAELSARQQRRKEILRELRTATASDRLEMHYQPVVNSDTQRIVGFEALMRWNHPVMGPVPPATFIPIAEEAGLMTELGAWAITRACEDLALLPPEIHMGVNVSANQFRSPELFAHIRDTLIRTGIAPSRLVFEITESVLVANADAARDLLGELRRLGAQVALDDFGTGYSSLSYLQKFPITVVKIDRSFVAGLLDHKVNQAVIRAVMGLGRDLGIRVVAEGVETLAQVEALKSHGCRLMQGYYFGKARPMTDVATNLALAKVKLPLSAPADLPRRQAKL